MNRLLSPRDARGEYWRIPIFLKGGLPCRDTWQPIHTRTMELRQLGESRSKRQSSVGTANRKPRMERLGRRRAIRGECAQSTQGKDPKQLGQRRAFGQQCARLTKEKDAANGELVYRSKEKDDRYGHDRLRRSVWYPLGSSTPRLPLSQCESGATSSSTTAFSNQFESTLDLGQAEATQPK